MPYPPPAAPPARFEPTRPATVTRLVAQERHPDRVSVFLDGAFAFGVYRDVVIEFGLHRGQVLSVEAQRRILRADRIRRARSRALHYLAHRARTTEEVRRKLLQSGFEAAVVEAALERLVELGYLDDAAYARAYVRGRFRSRGYGPARLRSELMRRGVPRALVEAAVQELLEEEDPLEAARSQARRRWARLAREADSRRRRKKLSDFLLRRGFTYDTVRRVVDELDAEA
ncbi:MAG: recombinase RecX [Bacteroidetes bacterium]|nr:MAG: recombinase RecX [Bacteroidota bacterium]